MDLKAMGANISETIRVTVCVEKFEMKTRPRADEGLSIAVDSWGLYVVVERMIRAVVLRPSPSQVLRQGFSRLVALEATVEP